MMIGRKARWQYCWYGAAQILRRFAKGPLDACKEAGLEFVRIGSQVTGGAKLADDDFSPHSLSSVLILLLRFAIAEQA